MRRHLPARFQAGPRLPAAPAADLPLDSLELRDAIVGQGIVMHETPDGGFEIHLVLAGAAQRLGWFPDAAAAWRALDDIDRHPDEWTDASTGDGRALERSLQ